VLISYYAQDFKITISFVIEKIFLYLFFIEFLTLFGTRGLILILSHVFFLTPYFHFIKKVEYMAYKYVNQILYRGKKGRNIKIIKIEKQPWIEAGMIRCGDPKCKMMHSLDENKNK